MKILGLISASAAVALGTFVSLNSTGAEKPSHSCVKRSPASVPGCVLVEPEPEQVTYLPDAPNFFFKPSNDGSWLFYITERNNLISADGKKSIIVPGPYDGNVSEDSWIAAVPDGGLQIYSFQDMIKTTKPSPNPSPKPGVEYLVYDEKPLLDDQNDHGVYESIGILDERSTQNSRVYRIITEDTGDGSDADSDTADQNWSKLWIREVRVTRDPKGKLTAKEVGPKLSGQDRAKVICADKHLTLPMLSKIGKELAAFDVDTQSTKIFKLTSDGKCTEALDLHQGVGKVDFNRDSSQITFHTTTFQAESGGWFSGIGDDEAKNIELLSLKWDKKGKAVIESRHVLTAYTQPASGGYYPHFAAKTGEILYFRQQRVDEVYNSYSIVRVNPQDDPIASETWLNSQVPQGSCLPDSRTASSFALATIWKEVCDKSVRPEDAIHFSARLSPNDCKVLVDREWKHLRNTENFIRDYKDSGLWSSLKKKPTDAVLATLSKTVASQISEDDLLAACPKYSGAVPVITKSFGTMTRAEVSPQAVLHGCFECHHAGGKASSYPFPRDSSELDIATATAMKAAIEAGTMPKDSKLPADQKTAAINFLADLITEKSPGPSAAPAQAAAPAQSASKTRAPGSTKNPSSGN